MWSQEQALKSRAPGFGVLVEEDPETTWKGLLRKILALPELESAVSGPRPEPRGASNGTAPDASIGSDKAPELEPTLENVERKLALGLRHLRSADLKSDEGDQGTPVISPWHTGPLTCSGSDRLDGAKNEDREALRTAVVSVAQHSRGLWAYELTLTSSDPNVELGWAITHTVDGVVHQDYARFILRSGQLVFQNHKVACVPSNFWFRHADTIGCTIDISRLAFSFTCNGVHLSEVVFTREPITDPSSLAEADGTLESAKSVDDIKLGGIFPPNTHPMAPNNGVPIAPRNDPAPRVPQATTTPSIPIQQAHPSSKNLKVTLGLDASFRPACSTTQTHRLNLGEFPFLNSFPGYSPIVPVRYMQTLEKQCNLLLAVLDLTLPHSKIPAKRLRCKSRHSLPEDGLPPSVIDEANLRQLLSLLIYSERVGLKAIFSESNFIDAEHSEGCSHARYVAATSVIPFLIRMTWNDSKTSVLQTINTFVGAFREDDEWTDNFLGSLASCVNDLIVTCCDDLKVHVPQKLSLSNNYSWTSLVKLLTAMAMNERWYRAMSTSGLMTVFLSTTFLHRSLVHPIRLAPYIEPAFWDAISNPPKIEPAVLEPYLVNLRSTIRERQLSLGELVHALASHQSSDASDATEATDKNVRPTNSFLAALRRFVSVNTDLIRGRASTFSTRRWLNVLFFSFLAAIDASNADNTNDTLANGRLGGVLFDVDRANVDRLGGTFGHVRTEYPNPMADLDDGACESPADRKTERRSWWKFELMDACAYLFHHSVSPSITQAQQYANDVEVSGRMLSNVKGTRAGRDSVYTADLDLLDLVNIQQTRQSYLAMVMSKVEIMDILHLNLFQNFSRWLSQALIGVAFHEKRHSFIHYFPESHINALILVENTLHIPYSSQVLGSVIPYANLDGDDLSVLPKALQDCGQHNVRSMSSAALMALLQKKLILNPNLQSVIVGHMSNVVSWSLSDENENYLLGPNRISQWISICLSAFSNSRINFWSQVLGGMMPILCYTSKGRTAYQGYFKHFLQSPENLPAIEQFLNQLFNLVSMAENELDTHIDTYIEKLKLNTSNVEQLVLDPNRDNENPRRQENRNRTEERGFPASSAPADWIVEKVGNDRVVVVLPTDVYERRTVLARLPHLSSGWDAMLQEAPAYTVLLSNLLLLLWFVADYRPQIFENSLIMTRTCEVVGHTLRRALDPVGSAPFIKLLRLFGRTIQPGATIEHDYRNSYDFYDFGVDQLVWSCSALASSLLSYNKTQASFLSNFHGLLPVHVIDQYLALQIDDINDWDSCRKQLEQLKVSESRQVLLRSGQEECPICYTNPVNTTFLPCRHRSCRGCIDRHLLNNNRCFFCKAVIQSTTRD